MDNFLKILSRKAGLDLQTVKQSSAKDREKTCNTRAILFSLIETIFYKFWLKKNKIGTKKKFDFQSLLQQNFL